MTLKAVDTERLRFANCVPVLTNIPEMQTVVTEAREALSVARDRRRRATIIRQQLQELVNRGFFKQALLAAKGTSEIDWLTGSETEFLKIAAIQAETNRRRLIAVSILFAVVVLVVILAVVVIPILRIK